MRRFTYKFVSGGKTSKFKGDQQKKNSLGSGIYNNIFSPQISSDKGSIELGDHNTFLGVGVRVIVVAKFSWSRKSTLEKSLVRSHFNLSKNYTIKRKWKIPMTMCCYCVFFEPSWPSAPLIIQSTVILGVRFPTNFYYEKQLWVDK